MAVRYISSGLRRSSEPSGLLKIMRRFPIQEYGMNYESQPLSKHEIEQMKVNPVIVQRIIESYKLMLDFYGMRLVSEETGLVGRSAPPRNYATRYHNLVSE